MIHDKTPFLSKETDLWLILLVEQLQVYFYRVLELYETYTMFSYFCQYSFMTIYGNVKNQMSLNEVKI